MSTWANLGPKMGAKLDQTSCPTGFKIELKFETHLGVAFWRSWGRNKAIEAKKMNKFRAGRWQTPGLVGGFRGGKELKDLNQI